MNKTSHDPVSLPKESRLLSERLRERFKTTWFYRQWLRFDRRVDGALSFFFKHYGKTRFMIAMSKKVQYLGIEKLWYKSPKAFVYFFLFYLIRDTILYIIIPIVFAAMTSQTW